MLRHQRGGVAEWFKAAARSCWPESLVSSMERMGENAGRSSRIFSAPNAADNEERPPSFKLYFKIVTRCLNSPSEDVPRM